MCIGAQRVSLLSFVAPGQVSARRLPPKPGSGACRTKIQVCWRLKLETLLECFRKSIDRLPTAPICMDWETCTPRLGQETICKFQEAWIGACLWKLGLASSKSGDWLCNTLFEPTAGWSLNWNLTVGMTTSMPSSRSDAET